MLNIRTIMRTGFTGLVAVLLIGLTPMTTFADASSDAPAPVPCVAPTSTQNGVHTPTGSDSSMFKYQCDGPYAGQYISDYYNYSPETNVRTPRYAPNYSYDCAANLWKADQWSYVASSNSYRFSRATVAQPAGATTDCPVAAPTPSANDQLSGTSSVSKNTAADTVPGSNANQITSSGGAVGNSALDTTGDTSRTFNNATNVGLNNTIKSNGLSGNSTIFGNTTGGDATTGNVIGDATVVNSLQTTSNALGYGTNVKTFTANINGDITGDLLFDPGMLKNVQNASTNTNFNNNLTVNNSTNATVNNDINVGAKSGDASVSSNTTGGNATTGNATALVKVINMINSAVMSGQSFIGTININGNLNGDILLPPDFIDQLIASNVPTISVTVPVSANSNNTNLTNNTNVANTNNLGINNNVNSTAASGNAAVTENTAAGSATSGAAKTKVINAFNLTGSNVVGANSMLVFVNVVGGHWVGLIVNAPAGATAAEVGGGITQNTNVANNYNENNKLNATINNNINVAAQSGDASVTRNTTGGNAKSGDANTVVDLANIENSTRTLSGWFGILYINVFGSWNGSFGINTTAGDAPIATTESGSSTSNTITTSSTTPAQVFRYVPSSTDTFAAANGGTGIVNTAEITTPQAVLAATTTKSAASSLNPTPKLDATKGSNWTLPIGLLVMAVILIGSDRIASRRRLSK